MLIQYFENSKKMCSLCPFCSNESNQTTLTELYLALHMEVQLLKQSPKLKLFTIKGKWNQSSLIIPAKPAGLKCAHQCTGYHKVIISHPFHHSSDWQEKRAKMTSKVMHCIPAYYFLKCVSACCGAQVLKGRLLLLLEKPAFDWSCLRSELTLHETEEHISAFRLVAICYPLTFAEKRSFSADLHF